MKNAGIVMLAVIGVIAFAIEDIWQALYGQVKEPAS